MKKSMQLKVLSNCLNERQGRIYDFLEGGGGFSNNFRKFCRSFFRSTELIFRALPKHSLVPVLAKFSAPYF